MKARRHLDLLIRDGDSVGERILEISGRCRHWSDGVESQAFGRAFKAQRSYSTSSRPRPRRDDRIPDQGYGISPGVADRRRQRSGTIALQEGADLLVNRHTLVDGEKKEQDRQSEPLETFAVELVPIRMRGQREQRREKKYRHRGIEGGNVALDCQIEQIDKPEQLVITEVEIEEQQNAVDNCKDVATQRNAVATCFGSTSISMAFLARPGDPSIGRPRPAPSGRRTSRHWLGSAG